MQLTAREMLPDEAHVVTSYFHNAMPEYLEMLGVDPTRVPAPATWQTRIAEARP